MSSSPGASSLSYVSEIPQKRRVTEALDREAVGVPVTNAKLDRATENQATDTAPTARRKPARWQIVS